MRHYSALSQNDIISVRYNDKVYELLCMEIKPKGPGISIVETDLEVGSYFSRRRMECVHVSGRLRTASGIRGAKEKATG